MPYFYSYSQFMLKYYFLKKSVHSSLGLSNTYNTTTTTTTTSIDHNSHCNYNFPPISKCGLGLISNDEPKTPTTSRVIINNPNVIESSSVKSLTTPKSALTASLPPASSSMSSKKKDARGRIGFIDEMGGGVNGLMSCTESLGFESCDERRVDDEDEDHGNANDSQHNYKEFCEGERDRYWRKKRSRERRLEIRNKKFPPPLSSLNQNGQPCFYLKPVRQNGRLELTEVKIERYEVLRAVRENGRLRLHLVSSSDVMSSKIDEEEEEELEEEEEEEEEEELEEKEGIEEEEEEKEETEQEEQEQEQELHLEEEEEDVEEKEEKKTEELWKYRVSGEGFRRCHELVMSHHHHHDYHHHHHHINEHNSLHVWRQPCVTTR